MMLPQVIWTCSSMENISDRYPHGILPNFPKIFVQMSACHRGLCSLPQIHTIHSPPPAVAPSSPLAWFIFLRKIFVSCYVLHTHTSFLISWQSCILKCSHSLKFSCISDLIFTKPSEYVFRSTHSHVQSHKQFFTQETRSPLRWNSLSSYFTSYTINMCPVCSLFCAMFFTFFCDYCW